MMNPSPRKKIRPDLLSIADSERCEQWRLQSATANEQRSAAPAKPN
jgi:hypothetical protein